MYRVYRFIRDSFWFKYTLLSFCYFCCFSVSLLFDSSCWYFRLRYLHPLPLVLSLFLQVIICFELPIRVLLVVRPAVGGCRVGRYVILFGSSILCCHFAVFVVSLFLCFSVI
jgi:hypothetical protein